MSLQTVQLHHSFQNADTPSESAPSSSDGLYDILTYSGYFLCSAIFGVFIRIVSIPLSIIDAFAPHQFEQYLGDKVQGDSLDCERINNLAKKMGIATQFDFYIGKAPAAGIRGTNYACSDRLPFVMTKDSVQLTKYAFDYVVTSELCQFADNQKLYHLMYNVAIAVLEIACVIIFSAWTIPLIEVAASIGKMYIERTWEKNTDLKAVQHLKTADGALEFLNNQIQNMKNSKKATAEELLDFANINEDGCAKSTVGFLLNLKGILITSEGNVRLPVAPFLSANPLTERVKYLETVGALG